MRDRLADCCRFMHLAHMTPQLRVETWLESKTRTRAGLGVRLYPIDFELVHYSAGVSFRVMRGREHIRIETVQDAFVASFRRILCSFLTSRKPLNICIKCLKRA